MGNSFAPNGFSIGSNRHVIVEIPQIVLHEGDEPDALTDLRDAEFVEHYHFERNHQGLDNRLITRTPVADAVGRVRRRSRLGGLLNYYRRAA